MVGENGVGEERFSSIVIYALTEYEDYRSVSEAFQFAIERGVNMHREITLPQDTRCFRKDPTSGVLCFQGEVRRKGEVFTISPSEDREYDHRLQKVVSFRFNDQEYYMIVAEMNVPA